MAALILAVAVVALGAVLAWQNRGRLRRRRAPERTVWCVECGRELPVSRAVVVAEVPDDVDEREMVGGTVCIVEFCPEHAPVDA